MSNTREKGSSAVEMVFVLLVFLAFVTVVQKFSILAGQSHRLSVGLQNMVDRKMIKEGRPACLEKFSESFVRNKVPFEIFGDEPLAKKLIFVTRPICSGE